MKISDPLGKVYTHTMFKQKKKAHSGLSSGSKTNRNTSSNAMEEEIGEAKRANRASSSHHHQHTSRRPRDLESEEDGEEEEEEASEGGSLSTKSSRLHQHSIRSSSRRSLGNGSKDLDRISYASSSQRHHHHHSRRKSVVGLPYPPEGIGPPGTTYNLWTRDSFDHRRKFNRSLCGVLLGISIVLVILGILGIIGIAVYLGVVQKVEPDGKDILSIDGTFRITSEDFSISLLNPETSEYKRRASIYSKMISNTFERSPLDQAFLSASVAGFSSGSIRVFFTIRFDRRYVPSIFRDNFMRSLKRILSEEIASIEGGEFKGLEIDYSSIDFTKSSRPGDEIQFFRPEPYLGNEPVLLEKTKEEPGVSKASLWQSLLTENQKKPSPLNLPTTTTSTTTSSPAQSPNSQMSLLLQENRKKLILPPNRHPLELLTGSPIPVVAHSNFSPGSPKETVILNHPRRRQDPSYPFRPNSIPINPSSFFGGNRRSDEGNNNGGNSSFWDTFSHHSKSPAEEEDKEKQFQNLLSKQYANSYPILVSTSTSPSIQSTPKIKFEKGGTTSSRIISGSASLIDSQYSRPISVFNSGSSGLQIVDKSISKIKSQDQISIGGSFRVSGLEEELSNSPKGSRRSQSLLEPTPLPQSLKPVMVTPHGHRLSTSSKKPTQVSHTTPGPGNYDPPVDKTPHHLQGGVPDSGQQLIKHFLQSQRQKTELQRQRKLFLLKQKQQQAEEVKTKQQLLLQDKKDSAKILEYSPINNPVFHPSPRPQDTTTPLGLQPTSTPKPLAKRTSPKRRLPLPIRRTDLLAGGIPAVGSLSAGLTPLGIFSNLLNVYATIDSKHDITGKILDSATALFGRENPEEEQEQSTLMKDPSPSTTSSTTITTTESTTSRTTSPWTTTTTTTLSSESPFLMNYVKSNVSPDLPLRPKPPSDDLSRIPPRPYGSYTFSNHMLNQEQIYGVDNPLFFSAESSLARPSYGPKDFIVETVTIDSSILQDFFTSKPTLLNSGEDPQEYKIRGKESPSGDFGSSLLEKLQEMVNHQSSGGAVSTPSPKKVVTSKFKRYHIPPEIKITNDFSLSKFS